MNIRKKWIWLLLAAVSVATGSLYYYHRTVRATCISYYDKDGQTLLYKECE